MSVIINIDHETGDLTQYSSVATDSGDLSVAAGAALAGTGYGLSCLIDDTTNIYGQKTITADTSGTIRARFYVDPNTLTMANTNEFKIFQIYNNSSQITGQVALLYTTVAGYQIRGRIVNDAGTFSNTGDYVIADAPHYIEAKWIKATGAGANDGNMEIWIDGASKGTVTGIDNDTRFANFAIAELGACANIDAGTSGTLYLDELIINNDGGVIGPVITSTVNLLAGKLDRRGKL